MTLHEGMDLQYQEYCNDDGKLDDEGRENLLDAVASGLTLSVFNWVFKAEDGDISFDERQLDLIVRLVAEAMVEQFEDDQKRFSSVAA